MHRWREHLTEDEKAARGREAEALVHEIITGHGMEHVPKEELGDNFHMLYHTPTNVKVDHDALEGNLSQAGWKMTQGDFLSRWKHDDFHGHINYYKDSYDDGGPLIAMTKYKS